MFIDLIAAAISLICLYFFSQAWKVNGIIAALLVAQCLRATFFYVSSQRVIRLDYAKRKFAVLAIICALLTYASIQITRSPLWHSTNLIISLATTNQTKLQNNTANP
jgi:hypothetical protein